MEKLYSRQTWTPRTRPRIPWSTRELNPVGMSRAETHRNLWHPDSHSPSYAKRVLGTRPLHITRSSPRQAIKGTRGLSTREKAHLSVEVSLHVPLSSPTKEVGDKQAEIRDRLEEFEDRLEAQVPLRRV
ncbi:hypothetical protein CR513_55222, partial [Mucuna pruriens]